MISVVALPEDVRSQFADRHSARFQTLVKFYLVKPWGQVAFGHCKNELFDLSAQPMLEVNPFEICGIGIADIKCIRVGATNCGSGFTDGVCGLVGRDEAGFRL